MAASAVADAKAETGTQWVEAWTRTENIDAVAIAYRMIYPVAFGWLEKAR